jgi:hypothetical protein
MLYPSLQSRGDCLGIEILDWGGVGWGALGPEKHHFLQCRQHHQNRLNCHGVCLNFLLNTALLFSPQKNPKPSPQLFLAIFPWHIQSTLPIRILHIRIITL